jgi:hypothetical protein
VRYAALTLLTARAFFLFFFHSFFLVLLLCSRLFSSTRFLLSLLFVVAATGNHYPEKSACIFVVNVPRWFSMVWKVIKPFLDPVTLSKVQILRGKASIAAALLERIAPEQLPREYGGESDLALGDAQEEQLLWHVHGTGCR